MDDSFGERSLERRVSFLSEEKKKVTR